MSNVKKTITEQEIKIIAMEYIENNPSSLFNYKFVSINYNDMRFPTWSVIFEMRNKQGDLVDGPLVLGIDENGEIKLIG